MLCFPGYLKFIGFKDIPERYDDKLKLDPMVLFGENVLKMSLVAFRYDVGFNLQQKLFNTSIANSISNWKRADNCTRFQKYQLYNGFPILTFLNDEEYDVYRLNNWFQAQNVVIVIPKTSGYCLGNYGGNDTENISFDIASKFIDSLNPGKATV